MENIVISIIGFLGVVITNLITVKKENNKQKIDICNELEVVKTELETVKKEQKEARIDILKNFIVRCLDDLERGLDINDTTKERLYEALDLYTNKYHQNSYIHKRVEKLEKAKKL